MTGVFDEALGRADGLIFGTITGTIEYGLTSPSGDGSHFQVFDNGRLIGWELGTTQPDLRLSQPRWANLSMLTRSGEPNEIMIATSVIDLVTNEATWPPPLDEVRSDWGRDLPALPTGPLTVLQVLTRSPFGEVTTFFHLDKGRIVEAGVGHVDSPNLRVERTYELALRERAGTIDLMESIDGGRVDGSVEDVSVFLGGFEADECVAARRALTTPACGILAKLGEALSSRAWQEVAAGLDVELVKVLGP